LRAPICAPEPPPNKLFNQSKTTFHIEESPVHIDVHLYHKSDTKSIRETRYSQSNLPPPQGR
jgi:hypothetical protein